MQKVYISFWQDILYFIICSQTGLGSRTIKKKIYLISISRACVNRELYNLARNLAIVTSSMVKKTSSK